MQKKKEKYQLYRPASEACKNIIKESEDNDLRQNN